jgi:hypothetical protein
MGYTVDELPLDYKPYLHEDLIKTKVAVHVQGQTEDDVASEVDVPSKKHSKHKQVASSEDEHESTCEEEEEDEPPKKHKQVASSEDEHESTCEEEEDEDVEEEVPHEKHKKSQKHKKSKKPKKSKGKEIVESSEDEHESTCEEEEHESTCEEDEELLKMSPTVVDITSASCVPPPKDVQWAMHANNKEVEYATNFMINGKHIIKLHGTNAYVTLYTPENISGEGDVPEIGILEHSILSKLKLRPLSYAERNQLYGEDSEPESVEEDIQVDGPTDKSKVKWKKHPLDRAIKYSANLTVNGKHVLKLHKEDIILGLVTKEQLDEEQSITDFTLPEKQQLFLMGYLPEWNDPAKISA